METRNMKTKEKLLALLEQSRGQNISGEYIAGEIGVSRAAIWKAVKELEKDGHKIAAATRKGYRLEQSNDILSAAGIFAYLGEGQVPGGSTPAECPKTSASHTSLLRKWPEAAIFLRSFGSETGFSDILPYPTQGGVASLIPKLIVHPSLESTNITAKQAAISGAEHFTIILAEGQTAGKGRFGKQFFSPPGSGIYMSFVLRPAEIWLELPSLVTAFAAVAVCEAIEALGKSPQIKWVNDIFLDGKKICGISNEAGTDFESGEISWIVTGIGINFRAPDGGFPEEIRQTAGAIFGENSENPPLTRNQLAAEIIKNMSRISQTSKAVGGHHSPTAFDFLEEYRKRMLFIGEKITLHGGPQTPGITTATALGIDEIGRLVVRMSNGEICTLSSGEVSVRFS